MRTVILALAILIGTSSFGDEFKMSSLIVPAGISYEISPVRFSRTKIITEETFDNSVYSSSDSRQTNVVDRASRVGSEYKVRDTTITDKGFGGSGSLDLNPAKFAKRAVTEGFGSAIAKTVDVDVGAHYKKDYKTDEVSTKECSDSESENHHNFNAQQKRTAEDRRTRGTLGNSYLAFTITFQSKDVNNIYSLRPAKGEIPYVVLSGLSTPLKIPYAERQSFAIGVEGCVCGFKYLVTDEKILTELIEREHNGTVSDLKVCISGASFPIISQSGKNVLEEMALAQKKTRTTEIALSYGEANCLSPWRVKQKFGRSSGRRGQVVTLRDALIAINEEVAKDDSMPEQIFDLDAKSNWTGVYGKHFGEWRRKDEIPGVRIGEMVYVGKISDEILETPISSVERIAIFDARKEMWNTGGRARDGGLRMGLAGLFADYKEKERADTIEFDRYLLLSSNEDDCKRGIKMLRDSFDDEENAEVASLLLHYYPVYAETFEYNDEVADWIDYLKEHGGDVPDSWKEYPDFVFGELRKHSVPDAIVALAKSPSFSVSTNGTTLLMRIVKSKDLKLAQKFLDKVGKETSRINRIDDEHFTALTYAVLGNDLDMCKLLVEYGADVNFRDDKVRSIVEIASLKEERLPILKYLLNEKGAELGCAQYVAARYGVLNAVKFFVEDRKLDVNQFDDALRYGSMLLQAAAYGQLEVCRYLIVNGADINKTPNTTWFTSLERAAMGGHVDTVKYLLSLGDGQKIVHPEVLEKCSLEVSDLLANAGAISESSIKEFLYQAIKSDSADKVEEIILKNPELKDAVIPDWETTPLAVCVRYDAVNCAQRLKDMGANMNYAPKGRWVPLCYAAKIGSLKVFKFLLEECSVPLGDSAILAVNGSQKELLKYLLRVKINGVQVVDINRSNYGSLTLLSCAAYNGNNEMCRWLIANGARLDVKDNKGWTPLWRAVQHDKVETVRFLVENYHLNRDTIEAATIQAAQSGSLSALKYFLNQCNVSPLLDRKDGQEKCGCLLAEAAGCGYLDIVKYLVEEKSVPVDYTPVGKEGIIFNDDFYSALHMALVNGNAEVANYLRSKGAKKE